MTLGGPLALVVVIVLAAAAVTTGSRWQRALGLTLGLTALLPACLVPAEHTLLRPMWVVGAFAGVMRTTDLYRGRWSVRDRLVHVLSVVDTRRLVLARPAFDAVAVLTGLAWGMVAWASYRGLVLVGHPADAFAWLARWLGGLVFVYTLSAGAYCFLHAGYRVVGLVTPPLHVAPAAARSVQEFWGVRWNRTVSAWLGETFFRPLARRRRPVLGASLAFLASAVIHAYLTWVGVGAAMALAMLVFFLAQAVVIFLEWRLAVRSWPPAAGHAWTVLWMTGLSPLFTEPLVRALGV